MKHTIVIGDASDPSHLEHNKKTIYSMRRILDARHLIFNSSTDICEIILRCIEQVNTKYVVLACDDDFIVPTAMDNVIEFMEHNPSYEAAQGRQMIFETANNSPFSPTIKTVSQEMVDFSVEAATGAGRIRERMLQDTRLIAPKSGFCVMKTVTSRRIWREILSLGLSWSNNEKALVELVLLAGKIKLFDCLYIARQQHGSNLGSQGFSAYAPIVTQSRNGEQYEVLVDRRLEEKRVNSPDYFDQLVDPLFPEQYERMTNCLTKELVKQDGIGIEEARKIIKYWHWYFMAKNMMPKFYEHGGRQYLENGVHFGVKSLSKRFWQWARQSPFLRKMWWKVSDKISGDEMSLSSLLSPKSPYHKDFMPIYRAITMPPEKFNKNGREQESKYGKGKQF